jgi:phage-related protein
MLTGVLVGLEIDENAVRVTAVSEPYANLSVGATRRVTSLCQWQFRNPNTCGYAGSLLTCNFNLNSTGGCEGRHGGGVGASLKRAKFGGFAYLSSSSRLKTL